LEGSRRDSSSARDQAGAAAVVIETTTPWVYLVGAGPGDPELLTVKAARLLERADAVVYDRLVSDAVLDLVPRGTMRIYVGKATGAHHLSQDEINELLLRLARPGRVVVRLKGGDPFIFGRGSEEAAYLARHSVPFAVVPGITAAAGCAAAAGIPLTHRGLATGVRFLTGHCCAGRGLELDWQSLADPETTLVVYMGLANLPEISARLIAAGLPAATPAAAIASGTTPEQRVCSATLGDLPDRMRAEGLEAPVLIVIGRVVEAMAWLNGGRRGAVGDAGQRRGHG
jgi:uroporphyrin-III C-methyltransferase/precorrin-2 dehydrogenase/sirohydrochlorin ferrochelatase/uroporphyrin-III C-methyltransferase